MQIDFSLSDINEYIYIYMYISIQMRDKICIHTHTRNAQVYMNICRHVHISQDTIAICMECMHMHIGMSVLGISCLPL